MQIATEMQEIARQHGKETLIEIDRPQAITETLSVGKSGNQSQSLYW